jgi:PAS domain S-box-containing protein
MKGINKHDQSVLSLIGTGMPDSEVCRNLGITVVGIEETMERVSDSIEGGRASEKVKLFFESASRHRLEHTLRATQARFAALMDAMIAAVFVVDGRTGIIHQANSRAEELFGYERNQLVGRSVEELVPEQHRMIHPAYRIGFLSNRRKRDMGYHPPIYGLRSDGAKIEMAIALTATPVDDEIMVVCTEYSVWAGLAQLAAEHAQD